ncbi:MAG: hypothetical protein NTW31_03310 [Bacteroidetes bacterium]|nr:hypothetical protein [Bacteroidota bacterium]
MRKKRFEIIVFLLFIPVTRMVKNLCLLFLVVVFLASCEKFKGDQEVPAYLSIDSIYIYTDYAIQGSASQNITDSWVYVDGQLIGAFQNPSKFPVLQKGTHKVTIMPGIKKNGISSTRATYDFYAPISYNVKFGIDSVTKLKTLKTTYAANTNFLWKEDFEGTSIKLDTTNRSTVPVKVTTEGSPFTIEGLHSAIMVTDTVNDFAEAQSHDSFVIPYAPVYLELNYNINTVLTVGVILTGPYAFVQTPVVNLNVTNNKSKKIYIELTPALNSTSGTDHFRVYFGAFKDPSLPKGIIVLDNIKVVTTK